MVSIRDMAKDSTMQVAETLCKDATYIPEEKLDWSPMDYGKSPNAILSECAQGNMLMARLITGEEPSDTKTQLDFSALKDCIMDSARVVCAAIDSLSDADLEEMRTTPWGAQMQVAELIGLAAKHMNYHDGQINYIQLLLGDTKFHWVED